MPSLPCFFHTGMWVSGFWVFMGSCWSSYLQKLQVHFAFAEILLKLCREFCLTHQNAGCLLYVLTSYIVLVHLLGPVTLLTQEGSLLFPSFWHNQHFLCILWHSKQTLAAGRVFSVSFWLFKSSFAWHQTEDIPHHAVLWHCLRSSLGEVLPV